MSIQIYINDFYLQEHAQGLLEEIEDLLMTNKLLSKEKEEKTAAIEEGNRKNIAMKRNIEEVKLFLGINPEVIFNKYLFCFSWKIY